MVHSCNNDIINNIDISPAHHRGSYIRNNSILVLIASPSRGRGSFKLPNVKEKNIPQSVPTRYDVQRNNSILVRLLIASQSIVDEHVE